MRLEHETQEEVSFLDANMRPAIWLVKDRGAQNLTKLGGLPWLPSGVSWPVHGVSNTPLHFLGQVNLSELPETPLGPGEPCLPRSGMLFFFADIEGEMLWDLEGRGTFRDATRVLFSEGVGAPVPAPNDTPHIHHDWGRSHKPWSKCGKSVFNEVPLQAYPIKTYGEQLYFQDRINKLASLRQLRSAEDALQSKFATFNYYQYDKYDHLPAAILVDPGKPTELPSPAPSNPWKWHKCARNGLINERFRRPAAVPV